MLFDFIQSSLDVTSFSAILAAIVVLLTTVYCFMRDRGLPPGPTGIPVLGIYPFLKDENLHLQLDGYVKKYGDLSSFRLAGRLFINLGSMKVIREAHVTNSEYFAGRYTDFNVMNFTFNGGVAFINGEPWKVLRKFFFQIFKDIGMMSSLKDNTSGPMYDTLNSLITDLRNLNGLPVNIIDILNEKCSNVLRRILFGENGITEEQMRNIIRPYGALLEAMSGTNLLLTGELAERLIFRFKRGYSRIVKNQKLMEDAVYEIIDQHENTFDEDHVRNIVDAYLKERNERRQRGDPTADYFTRKALMGSLSQFIGDGILSVIHFIGIFFIALIKYPEEQDKIYEEILDVVGPNRQPTLEDKSNLPYTNAFIFEIMRMSNFFPFFPSLICTKETTIRGYRIPEGTVTVMNVWSAQHDPKIYEDPYKFDPYRYIARAGTTRPDLPLVFGVGKRACMGEAFSMMEVFLFLTTVVKNFRLILPEGEKFDSSLFTMKLKCCAKPRYP
ncbi:Cytochrome P450 2A9, partial [Stegodyphus mimosarum]